MSRHWYEVETTGRSGHQACLATDPDDAAAQAFQCEKLLVAASLKAEFGTVTSALKTDKCEDVAQAGFKVKSIRRR